MKKDYYVYNSADMVIFGQNLTESEAATMVEQIITEYPQDSGVIRMASISADPSAAARIAFAHIANW